MPAGLSELAFAVCCLAAVGGAVVQSVIGFGYALLVVPALLVIQVDLIPVAPLVVATPMVLWLGWVERRGFDSPAFWHLMAGRVPGTAVGAWLVGIIGAAALSEAAGALLLLAAASSFARGARRVSRPLEVGAGFASGIAGTVGAVGGPYLGLAMADRPGPTLRATISVAFAVGIVLSLVALLIAGRVERDPVVLGLWMIPATGLGMVLGRRVTHWADRSWLRPAVLGVAAAAGVFAIVRGALG